MTKAVFLAGAILFQAVPALAQVYAPDPFAACGTIADDRARLACYDTARRQGAGPRPQPVAPAPSYAPVQPAPAPMNEFGGLKAPAPPPPAMPRRLAIGVASYTFNPQHKFVVTLDNGQVWRQFLDDDGTAKFKSDAKNYVVITHVFWNSYDLKLNTMNAVFRVQRMK